MTYIHYGALFPSHHGQNKSPDMEVRRKAIGIALAMVTSRNVEEVVMFLKKQLQRTLTEDYDKVDLSILACYQIFSSPFQRLRLQRTVSYSFNPSMFALSSSRRLLRA